jgi:aminoglycoside phosphotransferase (APT) family kinase protein
VPYDPPDSARAADDIARAAAVLRALGSPDAPLLGSGVESQVFAVGPDVVVKIYRAQDRPWQERCEAFVARLAAADPPFALPVTLDTDVVDDTRYAIQRRVPGHLLADVLPALRGAERERALLSYLDTAEAIGRLDFASISAAVPALTHRFGHLLGRSAEPSNSWPDFLRGWSLAHLRRDEAGVREDVPTLDTALARYDALLPLTADVTEPRLVHGDYWPENVLIGDDHSITGVVDWSANVLAGDPRVDLAQSIVYLDMLDSFVPADVPFLLREATRRHGPRIEAIVDLYRLHYALMYAADCKHLDPLTYRWCLRHLRSMPERSATLPI